ncbi:hypothetical protein [Natronospora cellulosivora (SeqCode)]
MILRKSNYDNIIVKISGRINHQEKVYGNDFFDSYLFLFKTRKVSKDKTYGITLIDIIPNQLNFDENYDLHFYKGGSKQVNEFIELEEIDTNYYKDYIVKLKNQYEMHENNVIRICDKTVLLFRCSVKRKYSNKPILASEFEKRIEYYEEEKKMKEMESFKLYLNHLLETDYGENDIKAINKTFELLETAIKKQEKLTLEQFEQYIYLRDNKYNTQVHKEFLANI